MTMYQRNRIKEEIERQNAAADANADRLLDKLRASKWTAGILLASVVILIVIAGNYGRRGRRFRLFAPLRHIGVDI